MAAALIPCLTLRGCEVNLSGLKQRMGAKNVSAMLKALTFRAVPSFGAPPSSLHNLRTIQCYRIDEDILILPRRMAHKLAAMPGLFRPEELCRLTDAPGMFGGIPHNIRRIDPARAEFAHDMYPYQEAYIEHVCSERLGSGQRQRGCAQVYVHVETGLGKTAMTMALISRLRVPALVIVPTLALQDTGIAEANKFVPGLVAAAYSNAEEKKAAKRGQPGVNARTADIVYCVVNTARMKPPEFFSGFGVIVFDEAHEFQSPTSFKLMWTAQAPCVVALSATPTERQDKLDRALFPFVGSPLSLHSVVPPDLIGDVAFEGMVR